MGASYEFEQQQRETEEVFDALFEADEAQSRRSVPANHQSTGSKPKRAVWRYGATSGGSVPENYALRLIQDRADIDISGSEFNFVRFIRVFHIRHARQRESGQDSECNRNAVVVLGTYGTQGDFSWQRSSIATLPPDHVGLERWGEHCPSIYHRSVFVEWRDFEGNYGFEQVNY